MQYIDFRAWGLYRTQAPMHGAKEGEKRYGVDACPVTLEVEVTNAVRYSTGEKFVVGSNAGLPIHAPWPLDLLTVKALHINLRWFKNFENHHNPGIQRWLGVNNSESWKSSYADNMQRTAGYGAEALRPRTTRPG